MTSRGLPANFTIKSAFTAFPETAGTEFGHDFGWRELFTFLTAPAMLFVMILFGACLACCKREENKSININAMQTSSEFKRAMEDVGLI